jgi:hypothetical protein
LPFADRRRCERPVPIARHLNRDRTDVGDHRLRPGAVALLPPSRPAGSCFA